MPSRLTLLPDKRFAGLLPSLRECLASAASSITAETFASMLDDTMQRAIELPFRQAGADEGTVWLVDEAKKALVPAYNTGPYADKIVAKFRQPLDRGLASMVFVSERPFTENAVRRNAKQDKALDRKLKIRTVAMMIVPFYFLDACRGVVSCVKLEIPGVSREDSGSFTENAQRFLIHGSATLGRLLDLRVLRTTLGLR